MGQSSGTETKDRSGVEKNMAPARVIGSHRKQKCPNQLDSGLVAGWMGVVENPDEGHICAG